ncbi:MAG: NAD(P)H-binding protein [Chloroflexota bacterium]
MSGKTFVIAGATGNTGSVISKQLLEQGHTVRAIGRSMDKLQELPGVEPHAGQLDDADFLKTVLAGADAFYTLLPYNYGVPDLFADQMAMIDANVKAIQASGMRRVVALSSYGAHIPADGGVLDGLREFEQALAKTDAQVTVIRAGFFFQNFLGMVGTVHQHGILAGYPVHADITMPMVDTADVAGVAVEELLRTDSDAFNIREAAGTRLYTLHEAASILGQSIGKPDLAWVQFPYDDASAAMQSYGFSASVAEGFIDFARRANDLSIWGDVVITDDNRTGTPLEDFTDQFANVYKITGEA